MQSVLKGVCRARVSHAFQTQSRVLELPYRLGLWRTWLDGLGRPVLHNGVDENENMMMKMQNVEARLRLIERILELERGRLHVLITHLEKEKAKSKLMRRIMKCLLFCLSLLVSTLIWMCI